MVTLKKTVFVLSIFTLVMASALIVLPDEAWASANPCEVTCSTNGWFLYCTWSYAGDPNYCCWTNPAVGCQSYNCNTGALALSKLWC